LTFLKRRTGQWNLISLPSDKPAEDSNPSSHDLEARKILPGEETGELVTTPQAKSLREFPWMTW
jgi:hypothetical protein